jgi:hypothetical protein
VIQGHPGEASVAASEFRCGRKRFKLSDQIMVRDYHAFWLGSCTGRVLNECNFSSIECKSFHIGQNGGAKRNPQYADISKLANGIQFPVSVDDNALRRRISKNRKQSGVM